LFPQIAYHGTRRLREVLREGLTPQSAFGGCRHVCLAARPELAANFGTVLRVDVSGLEVVWEKGEGRIHEAIPRERIRPLGLRPTPSWDGWEDPGLRHNHIACLARQGVDAGV
jgi:hypothetical protein